MLSKKNFSFLHTKTMEEKNQLHQDIENSTQENYQKLYELFVKEKWDPHMLQTSTPEEIQEYTDFLMGVKEYYEKIKAWIVVTKEEREKFGPYLEESWWINNNIHGIEREVARLTNMKDIAYHKYLWMTRWKMPWYEYIMDSKKNPTMFTEFMQKSIEKIHPTQKFNNVSVNDIYSRNPVDYTMDIVKSHSGRNNYIKNTESFNGLDIYLNQLNARLENTVRKNLRWWNQFQHAMQMLLELRYMYEVADATHSVSNRNMISSIIEKIEVAIQTVQNNDFEAQEAKKKSEMEEKALLEYCQKNSVSMEDIIIMQTHIAKMQKENELKDESLSQTTQSLEEMTKKKEEEDQKNKEKIAIYEKIFQEISEQAKKSLLGSDYKVSQELIEKIREIMSK